MRNNTDDLKHIRSMMERSSKFVSLSGISGVAAGVCAIAGAVVAYFVLEGKISITGTLLYDLVIIATTVLACAVTVSYYFSYRKAQKSKSILWTPATLQIAKDFGVPMVVGGLFCIILISKNVSFMVAPTMLIFYGLALIYVGARTFRDIRILGACEIILGLVAGVVVGYDLVFWGIGFGLLHIIYGTVMHFKYDKESGKNEMQ